MRETPLRDPNFVRFVRERLLRGLIEILFFLVSRYGNLGELCMHFELQVGSPWANLAEIWPICCQIVYLQIQVCEL